MKKRKNLNEHEMAVGSTTLYTLVEDIKLFCAKEHQGSENRCTSALVRRHDITFAPISKAEAGHSV